MREIAESELLETLTTAEREHVSIGLEHNFAVTLCGEERIGFVLCAVESGQRVSLDPHSITVGDIWKSAEAMSD